MIFLGGTPDFGSNESLCGASAAARGTLSTRMFHKYFKPEDRQAIKVNPN